MPRPTRRKESGLAEIAWSLNGLGLGALLIIGIIYFSRGPVDAAPISPIPLPPANATPGPSLAPAPTRFHLRTVTPHPTATAVENYPTPTAFDFADGPAPRIIGYSLAGRPINVYTFGQGGLHYLIIAGIHGGYEGNTVDLANQMMLYVNQHPETVPSSATLHIVPDMNPDAVVRGKSRWAKVNNNGVDLNRNFPAANWVAKWDRSRCWQLAPTTAGTAPGSEPETRAIMSFILGHHIEALISYHAAALGIFPGGNPWQPESEKLADLLGQATGYPYPPLDIGCAYTGTLADWAVENGVGAAVDMELSNHHDTDFVQNLKALKALLSFLVE